MMQSYIPLFRDVMTESSGSGAWKERRRSSNSSSGSSHDNPESPLLPGWEAVEPNRNSRRAWLLAFAIAAVLGLLLAVQGIERVATFRDSLLLGSLSASSGGKCSDPYLEPGLLWRSANASMARWLPYDTTVSLEPEDTEFRTIGGNYSIDDLPENVLKRLPPSLSLALLDRSVSSTNDSAAPSQLEFLRGKKVALVGCSLDRIAMISMCLTLGKGQADLVVDDHDFSSCYFKDLDLSIEVWFHGGVRQGTRVFGDDWYATQGFMKGYEFESRMESNYLWRARNSTSPDLIILASGTWDQVWLTSAYTPIEDLSAQTVTTPERVTPVLPLQAYDYYRTRLRDMVRFLRAEFPEASVMFRPETYQIYRNSNAITYNIREAAIAAMRTVKVPIFSWGEKLNGEQDMIDPVHFRAGSAANWLYADMLMHYLRRHVEKRDFCDAE